MPNRAAGSVEKVTRQIEDGHPQVLARLRRMVASLNGAADADLEQEVFIRVLEAFRRLEDVRSPYGLMRKIARDAVVDSWRTRRVGEDIGQLPELCRAETPRPEERLDRERTIEHLKESILELGCDIRGPVYLFYIEGYSIPTLVRILRKSPSAIKMALHRGRRQLGRMLGNSPRTPTKKVRPNARSGPGGSITH